MNTFFLFVHSHGDNPSRRVKGNMLTPDQKEETEHSKNDRNITLNEMVI